MDFFRSKFKKADKSALNVFDASQPGLYKACTLTSIIPSKSLSVVPQGKSSFSKTPDEPLPQYSAVAPQKLAARPVLGSDPTASSVTDTGPSQKDDPFAFLSTFDTVFLIDDSSSMTGNSWREVAAALELIAPICTKYDKDGIDVYFLNHKDEPHFHKIRSAEEVKAIFRRVSPLGITPTGTSLKAILKPYLKDLKKRGEKVVKPLNMIVITDGRPSDDPESVIIEAAKKLDAMDAPPWQVGIQFFQVGRDGGAAEALRHLDDGLVERGGGIRDMVDTVPWSDTNGDLNADGIMKVVLGAVNRRLDRKPFK